MYKLFLSLRYLRRRPIALVAIIGMALCVFMVIVVASVMNGFLDQVATAARGLMGDVVIDGYTGIPHYQQLIEQLNAHPDIRAATPVTHTYGLLKFGPRDVRTVSVMGIRLPEATEVTAFGRELHPPALQGAPAFELPPDVQSRLAQRNFFWQRALAETDREIEELDRQLEAALDAPPSPDGEDRIAALEGRLAGERQRAADIRRICIFEPEHPGVILGVEIPGTTVRDEATGQYQRYKRIGEAEKVQLTLLPLGRGTVGAMTEPVKKTFNLVGDQRFGIYVIDNSHVYVDFDVLNRLIEMGDRADQIQIRLADGSDEAAGNAGAAVVRDIWARFAAAHREDVQVDQAAIQTWRQKQAQYVDAVEKQRDLMVIILGIVSMVAVVLVFAIFYMMVVQKTKDIGILKSLGASHVGVAWVFLTYGSAVGLVGSVFGAAGGYAFVRNINAVHDWIATAFGWRVFSRQAYMFDRIPDAVDPWVIVWVMVGAMIAGLVGALLPALRAARMQPVEALRYE
ncbi:MAG: ABC transporter permease [Planctomycetes bacterium]|nr:ABC transporter permease [Planctomycetota bacterium]